MQLLNKIRRNTSLELATNLAANVCSFVYFLLLFPLAISAQAQSPDVWSDDSDDIIELDEFQVVSEFNAFDPSRIDPTYQLAMDLQDQGSHTEALVLFKEALHLSRINNGLYNDSQFELLEALIESEVALQNWEAVNKHYGYMEHLYLRLYDKNDPRLESGLQKVVTWHVNALNVNLGGNRIEHLQKANRIFKLRREIAQQTLGQDHPKMDYLNRNIEICERQLFLASDLSREMHRRQQRARQNSLLADLD